MSFPSLPAFAAARFVDGQVADFGDPAAELRAASHDSIIAPLSQFGVLRFSGADAGFFLHGQFSCDVKALVADKTTPGGYCTAQGRLLANFLLWRDADAFHILLARDILPAIYRRLQLYVLRAKVKIEDVSDHYAICGVAGPRAAEALRQAGLAPADTPYGCVTDETAVCLALPGGRHLALIRTARFEQCWTALTQILKPVGQPCWAWLDVVNGLPWITAATQDQFVPQMVNLEALGGVSFQKGCYPGQEVVARTQYRATTRRRMYRAHVDAEARAGMALYADTLGEQSCGTVVNTAPAPEGGTELLAVLHPDAMAATAIRLGAPDGPALALRELPYSVE
ncbi:MAG: folate-binding protein YgfZ [Pseudomonadota bacterium]|nr:MAG: folate-binding protein [Pseudomonadota bacterium]